MSEASEKKDYGSPKRADRPKSRGVKPEYRKKPAARVGASGKVRRGDYTKPRDGGSERSGNGVRKVRHGTAAGAESADALEVKNEIEVIEEDGAYIEERRIRDESEILHRLREESGKKLLSLLGFAARGRKLICGTDLCRDSIRRGVAIITIVASDASENTKKRIIDACRYYGSDMCVAPVASAELSHMIGKTGEIMVISVTDRHFADGIAALFEDGGTN